MSEYASPQTSHRARGGATSSELVAALRARQPWAAEELLARFGPGLWAAARAILGNEADAQDAVQEGLVGALRSIGDLRDSEALPAWIKRAVTNAALARLRSRKRRRERSIDELLPAFHEDGHRRVDRRGRPGVKGDPEQQEIRRMVRAAIDELPDSYREVVVLRDLLGLDGAEAAAVLGITSNAVKVRLHRARQALRSLLTPDAEGHS